MRVLKRASAATTPFLSLQRRKRLAANSQLYQKFEARRNHERDPRGALLYSTRPTCVGSLAVDRKRVEFFTSACRQRTLPDPKSPSRSQCFRLPRGRSLHNGRKPRDAEFANKKGGPSPFLQSVFQNRGLPIFLRERCSCTGRRSMQAPAFRPSLGAFQVEAMCSGSGPSSLQPL